MRGAARGCWLLAVVAACTANVTPAGEIEAGPVGPTPEPTLGPELLGPAPAVEAAAAGTMTKVAGVEVLQVGAAKPGFVWWMSHNARFAAIYTFAEAPQFGHHGEVRGGEPTLTLHDTVARREDVIDELVATDPHGRWLVALKGPALWLIDAESGEREDLAAGGAVVAADQNRCMPPRQADFDALGEQVVYMRGDDTAVIRRLVDGSEQTLRASGKLWRIGAVGQPRAALLVVVPEDSDKDGTIGLPRQKTSCACRWCGRFAASHGFYGWAGDAYRFTMVEGEQTTILKGPVQWLAPGVFADPEDGAPRRGDEAIALPNGCTEPQVFAGSPAVMIACGPKDRLWWPATGVTAELGFAAEVIEDGVVRAADGKLVLGLRLGPPDGPGVLAGFDAADGARVAESVEITGKPRADRRGRVLVHEGEVVTAFDLRRGTSRTFTGKAIDVGALRQQVAGTLEILGKLYAVDPGRGLLHELTAQPAVVAENGCALVPAASADRLDTGPWTLRCPGLGAG